MKRNSFVSGEWKKTQYIFPTAGEVWLRPDGSFYYIWGERDRKVYASVHRPRKSENTIETVNRILIQSRDMDVSRQLVLDVFSEQTQELKKIV